MKGYVKVMQSVKWMNDEWKDKIEENMKWSSELFKTWNFIGKIYEYEVNFQPLSFSQLWCITQFDVEKDFITLNN